MKKNRVAYQFSAICRSPPCRGQGKYHHTQCMLCVYHTGKPSFSTPCALGVIFFPPPEVTLFTHFVTSTRKKGWEVMHGHAVDGRNPVPVDIANNLFLLWISDISTGAWFFPSTIVIIIWMGFQHLELPRNCALVKCRVHQILCLFKFVDSGIVFRYILKPQNKLWHISLCTWNWTFSVG